MTTIYIQYSERCVDSHHSSEQFGDWSETYDFSVTGARLDDGVPQYHRHSVSEDQFTIDANVKIGDTLFVLYLIYSTGDSFGYAEGRGEILMAFKDPMLASAARNKFNEALFRGNRNDSIPDSVSIEVDGGKTIDVYHPASGYFEHPTALTLSVVTVL